MIQRLTNDQLKQQLINEVEKLQLLGFDSCAQALGALVRDADFVDTWDLGDQPKLIGLVIIAQKQLWPHLRGGK